VQWYLGPEGDQRIWYDFTEIEEIAAEELRRARLFPSAINPVTNLEQFVESHLNAELDQYADLPEDVLGLTEFPRRGRPKVSINRALTDAADSDDPPAGIVGRWRATLAHEASHVYLHKYLFDPELARLSGSQRGNVEAYSSERLMRCLHRDINPTLERDASGVRTRSDWREIQANRGMAALLMPGRIFKQVYRKQISLMNLSDVVDGSPAADLLTSSISKVFRVSKQAARIRLKTEGLMVSS
jgi:hypothetical protein